MEFIKKTELFFIQLQYSLTIEHETILQGEKGYYSLMLESEIFFNLIKDFNIDYPFIPKIKIIELKSLMSKENINTNDALKIIKNYKEHYWFLDTVVIFEPTIDKIKRAWKSIDSNFTEKEINIELINYQKHLQAKRENIYSDLILEIRGLTPQQTEIEKELPAPESPNIGADEEKKSINITNNFDLINIKSVYAYFKEKLVEKQYLSNEDLLLYLKAAFEQQIVPETKFVIKNATKGKAKNVFYEYFKNIAGKPAGKQKNYAALLGEYFEGYETNNVSTNWSK